MQTTSADPRVHFNKNWRRDHWPCAIDAGVAISHLHHVWREWDTAQKYSFLRQASCVEFMKRLKKLGGRAPNNYFEALPTNCQVPDQGTWNHSNTCKGGVDNAWRARQALHSNGCEGWKREKRRSGKKQWGTSPSMSNVLQEVGRRGVRDVNRTSSNLDFVT